MSQPKLILGSLAVVCLIMTAMSIKPGANVRITKKGFDYANQVAQKIIQKELIKMKLPEFTGRFSGSKGKYHAYNLQITGTTIYSSHIFLNQGKNDLEWNLRTRLELKGDYKGSYKVLAKLRSSGRVTGKVTTGTAKASIALGKDSSGRPTIRSTGCSVPVDVHLKFHGGASWVVNFFHRIINKEVEKELIKSICHEINKAINTNGNEELRKVKVTSTVAEKFLVDYRLTSTPKISSQYLETDIKGAIYWAQDQREPPFSPSPIASTTDVSKMLYIKLTEYTANSAVYAAHTHGFLSRNFTSDDLPFDTKGLLDTTCEDMCIGTIIPQIGKDFPNLVVVMKLASTSPPSVTIHQGKATLKAEGTIDMFATSQNKPEAHLVTLHMTVYLNLTAKLDHERLIGHVSLHKFTFGITLTDIGKIESDDMDKLLKEVLDKYGIPEVNELFKKGMDLPTSEDVSFVNPSLHFLEKTLMVATDIKYAA